MVHAEPKLTLGSKEAMPAPREHAALEDIDGRLVLGTWWDRLPYGNPLSPITLNVPKKDDPDHALHYGYGAMRSGLGTGHKYTEAIIPLGDPRVECPGASWGGLDFVKIEVLNPEVVDGSLSLNQQIMNEGQLQYKVSDTRGGEPVILSSEGLYAYAATIKDGELLKPVADAEEAQSDGPVVRGILFVSREDYSRSIAASRPSKFSNIYEAFDRRIQQQAATSHLGSAGTSLASMSLRSGASSPEAMRGQGAPYEKTLLDGEGIAREMLVYTQGGPSEGLNVLVEGVTMPDGDRRLVTNAVARFSEDDHIEISVDDPLAGIPEYTATYVTAKESDCWSRGLSRVGDDLPLQVEDLLTLELKGVKGQKQSGAPVKQILLYYKPPK